MGSARSHRNSRVTKVKKFHVMLRNVGIYCVRALRCRGMQSNVNGAVVGEFRGIFPPVPLTPSALKSSLYTRSLC